ncbi:DNAse I-like superfamily protein [Abeliophyllum distichum]|uniref:DNAse I-like superfamily protein n=1 Tax=Abeliophyllum distichum TaxID=126358 RepID=A0ABD1V6L8_9LAMI
MEGTGFYKTIDDIPFDKTIKHEAFLYGDGFPPRGAYSTYNEPPEDTKFIARAEPQPVDPIRPDIIPRLVSDEDNLQLNRIPTLAEVREAIFSIDPDSVAGPDGFSSHFFQECWDIISDDVFQAVLDFFAGGHFPRGFSATSIVLIPKRDNACRWSEFRPISLCTVFNKLVTKLLNSRLSNILPQIISAPQSGFIPGRLIGDNILLAQELLHTLDTKVRGGG